MNKLNELELKELKELESKETEIPIIENSKKLIEKKNKDNGHKVVKKPYVLAVLKRYGSLKTGVVQKNKLTFK